MRTDGMRPRRSQSEAPDVVRDVTDEKAPPDNKGQNRRHRGTRSRVLGGTLLPAHPVGRQQGQSDGDEVLFEVERAEGVPVTVVLQCWPDVDAKVPVHN